MMKPSTKAKKLQVKIAYYLLSGRKRPKELVPRKEWWTPSKVYHIIGPSQQEKHCQSCQCKARTFSLCKGFAYDTDNWRYRYFNDSDFEGKQPCKNCLRSLSKIANGR